MFFLATRMQFPWCVLDRICDLRVGTSHYRPRDEDKCGNMENNGRWAAWLSAFLQKGTKFTVRTSRNDLQKTKIFQTATVPSLLPHPPPTQTFLRPLLRRHVHVFKALLHQNHVPINQPLPRPILFRHFVLPPQAFSNFFHVSLLLNPTLFPFLHEHAWLKRA